MALRLNEKKGSFERKGLFIFFPHLVVLLITLAQTQIIRLFPLDSYNVQRWVQLVLFGVVFFAGCFLKSRVVFGGGRDRIIVGGGIALLLLGASASILRSAFPIWSLLDFFYLLLLGGMTGAFFVAFCLQGEEGWSLFGASVGIFMGGYSVFAILEVGIANPITLRITATPGFSNIRLFSDIAVVLIPLSWLALGRGLGWRLYLWIVGGVWFWLLLLTEARSGILSLFVGVAWVALFYKSEGKASFLRLLILGLVTFVYYYVFPVFSPEGELGWNRDLSSSSGRWELWLLSLQYFYEEFPYGIGGMMFAADGRYGVASPHNIIMVLLAEWGGLAFLGMLFIFFVVVFRARKRDEHRVLCAPVTVAAVASGINLMFAGAQIAPFSAIFLTLAWGGYLSTVFPGHVRGAGKAGIAVRSVAGAGLLVWSVVLGLAYGLYGYSEKTRASCDEERGVLFPRFWVQGRLDCGEGAMAGAGKLMLNDLSLLR